MLEILRISVLRIFDGADFWLTETKPQSTLYGLTRILTKGRLKYARQNHDSDYYCQAQHEGRRIFPFALHFVMRLAAFFRLLINGCHLVVHRRRVKTKEGR
ncbi:hypothetical protein [uncultured Ruminococcus sp.]|uniref:hypothetical protein n=1 Tax=uncultured Ruminococcus sp. TaxID=165186 RepID=UPI0029315D94|nr:hypothetical protein [uncultured Ruminococcus sp.]